MNRRPTFSVSCTSDKIKIKPAIPNNNRKEILNKVKMFFNDMVFDLIVCVLHLKLQLFS